MPDPRHRRYFTLDEAREQLTHIHALVSRLVELTRSLAARGWDVRRHEYFGGRGPNGDGSFPPEMDTVLEIVRGLERKGVVVEDLGRGTIDFPHLRGDGEEVYLCWSLGENDVRHWHAAADGAAGRRHINEL